jgi:hypothetical protein
MRSGHRARGAAIAAAALGVLISAAQAHDAIGSDARKAYLARITGLQQTVQSSATPSARAAALFQIGSTLDEIRELLNQDIVSHGKTQGLETSLLVQQLDALPNRLVVSRRTGLYQANLAPYREALALDGRAGFVTTAKFRILKGQFYDSFTDDPLRPIAQSRAELLEMISFGEALHGKHEPGLDAEEISFILALHYLQAELSQALPRARSRERFTALLHEFRERFPNSLKLATLEALSQ